MKSGSEKELRRLYDAATQHYRALKVAKTDSFDTVLTVILQQKLDEKTRLKWAEFSSEHESVPPCTELLKFLDLQARQLESVTQVGHKHAVRIRSQDSIRETVLRYIHRRCMLSSARSEDIGYTPVVCSKE